MIRGEQPTICWISFFFFLLSFLLSFFLSFFSTPFSGTFADELKELSDMLKKFQGFCDEHSFQPSCSWFSISDAVFIKEIKNGYAKPVPMCRNNSALALPASKTAAAAAAATTTTVVAAPAAAKASETEAD